MLQFEIVVTLVNDDLQITTPSDQYISATTPQDLKNKSESLLKLILDEIQKEKDRHPSW